MHVSVRYMKRTLSKQPKARPSRSRPKRQSNEMRSHYDFDYSKSRTNRFAGEFSEGAVAVVLDPDVADVFRDSKTVNKFLRSAITAMPHTTDEK